MPKFDEAQLESAIIELFQKNGFIYENGETIHRKYDEVILPEDLSDFLLNSYPNLTASELEKIINKLRYVPTTPLYKGNRQAFYLVNEGFDFVRDDVSKPPIHVKFIDYDNFENNIFKVVNQLTVVDVEWQQKFRQFF